MGDRLKILVADKVASEGLDILKNIGDVEINTGLPIEELCAIVGNYDALIVRSETKVTSKVIDAATNLKIIGRAGVGVDNIDIDAATEKGIVVVNSPTGNIVAAAEHAVAMMLALTRKIPYANESLKNGKWERSKFVGTELRGKTLGIVGLGKVGSEVAHAALGLKMNVIASDPYTSSEYARKIGVELVDLDTLLKTSDFITIHTALTSSTTGLIGESELAQVKPTARIINCARGGIIEERALLNALNEGRLSGAALDVFSSEPPDPNNTALQKLLTHEKVIVTPHLGASTEEAQIVVATDVAEQIADYFNGKSPRAAVNAPIILPETLKSLEPYIKLAEKLGKLYVQMHPGSIKSIDFTCSGEIAENDLRPVTAGLVKGILESVSNVKVNIVNAASLAKQRGLDIRELKTSEPEQFANLITIRVKDHGEEHVLSGTVVWERERIVRVDTYSTDFTPEGYILMCKNLDQPGMIGKVATILGEASVNIERMDVGPAGISAPRQPRGEALMVLAIDDPVPQWALDKISTVKDIFGLKVVKL